MPYKTNQDLPSNIKDNLPIDAQNTWRRIYNSALELYKDETRAIQTAWAGLKKTGYNKNEQGAWVKFKKAYNVPIAKIDEDKRQVFGWANVSHVWKRDEISKKYSLEQVVDSHNDMVDVEELEKCAYRFAKLYREGGEMHLKGGSATMIESMVFSIEKQQALGIPEGIIPQGWWIGFEVTDDNAWEGIKKGFYKAFSIEGIGIRTKIK